LRGFVVTPEFVLRIAPPFRGWVRSARPGWGELVEAGWLVRSELGVSQHAWGQACVVLGRMEAVTALAAIAARHAAGQVRSPGGLLRRMVELHQQGQLRLDRTLFGLADGLGDRRH
jgi:replication initiation protein RepC